MSQVEGKRLREWFAVWFGYRLLQDDKPILKLVRKLRELLAANGAPIRPYSYCATLHEEDNGEQGQTRIAAKIHRALTHLEAEDHPYGPHVPLVILVDDQSFCDIYEVLQTRFMERAFIINIKSSKLMEYVGAECWEPLEPLCLNMATALEDADPAEVLPPDVRRRQEDAERRSAEREREEERERYGSPASYQNGHPGQSIMRRDSPQSQQYSQRPSTSGHQERPYEYGEPPSPSRYDRNGDVIGGRFGPEEYGRQERRSNGYGSRGNERDEYSPGPSRRDDGPFNRRPPTPEPQQPQMELTIPVLMEALKDVKHNKQNRDNLAEDMVTVVDVRTALRGYREWLPRECARLLLLFVIAAENGDKREPQKVSCRKEHMQTALDSELMHHLVGVYLDAATDVLKDSDLNNAELDEFIDAIMYLLRGVKLLLDFDMAGQASAMALWTGMEEKLFGLPGRFWIRLTAQEKDSICGAVHKITTCPKEDFFIVIDKAIAVEERRRDQHERKGREEERRYDGRERSDRLTSGEDRREDDRHVRVSPQHRGVDEHYVKQDEFFDASEGTGDHTPTMDMINQQMHDGTGQQKEEEEMERYATSTEEFTNHVEYQKDGHRGEWEHSRNEGVGGSENKERKEYIGQKEWQGKEPAYQQRAQPPKDFYAAGPIIAWENNEKTAPPSPYWKLADRPTVEDMVSPMIPYLRRNVMDGSYTDNEHYLDVQFRLMREDMVAPLRDNLFMYKELGAYRNMQDRGTVAEKLVDASGRRLQVPDIMIFKDVTVSRIQVRPLSGEKMHFVTIPSRQVPTIDPLKQLKFGQVVVLSSDGFGKDFHMALIVERLDESSQSPFDGRFCVSIFEGEAPLDHMKAYMLAEPGSYFEAYYHVLRVMKKTRRYTPFPLERYLVCGKTDTRLPRYMRIKDDEKHIKEDDERREKYAKMKQEHNEKVKKRKEKKANKKKQQELAARPKKEAKRQAMASAGATEDEESDKEEEDPTETTESTSEEELEDYDLDSDVSGEGYDTDEEEEDYTRALRYSHPNPQSLTKITIQGQELEVDKLQETFKPESLDESQRKAICYALRSELAIIQGPPGTGKTHIGVELVVAILENRTRWMWTEPVLIVTYTNQALDQFLEKILVALQSRGLDSRCDGPVMVRLGSRSDSQILERQNVLVRDAVKNNEEELATQERLKCTKAYGEKKKASGAVATAIKIVRDSKKTIFGVQVLRQLMDTNHDQQLRMLKHTMTDTSNNPLNHDETLACWLLDKNYSRKRDMPGEDTLGKERDGALDFGNKKVEEKPLRKSRVARETKKEKNARKKKEKNIRWGGGADSESEGSESDDEGSADDNEFPEWDDVTSSSLDQCDVDKELLAQFTQLTVEAKKVKEEEALNARLEECSETYEVDAVWELEKHKFTPDPSMRTIIFGERQKERGGGRGGIVAVDSKIISDLEETKEMILKTAPLTRKDVEAIVDIRTLPKMKRWSLLVYWQDLAARVYRNKLDELIGRFRQACVNVETASKKRDVAVLRHAMVIGATTTGAAKRRKLIAAIAPKVVVVEEAAEVLEAHLFASLVPSVQHAIFIGDHKQLRPSASVDYLAKTAGLDISLFERMATKINYPYRTLLLQHRMLKPLTKFIVRPHFYPDLSDAPKVADYPSVLGMGANLFMWAHAQTESWIGFDETSHKNEFEVEQAYTLTNYLVVQGQYQPSEITIIATYAAQVTALKRRFERNMATDGLQIETVDSYQGKENRIVILSLVRSDSESIGFLGIANRICVALTRAQHGLYILGNIDFLSKFGYLWNDIRNSLISGDAVDWYLPIVCQAHGHRQGINMPNHFMELARYGGCTEMCGGKLICGHECRHQCHPPWQHEARPDEYRCMEPCSKKCERCSAMCKKKCYEDCGACIERITLTLPCGHQVQAVCSQSGSARCREPCSVMLPCGHHCAKKCSAPCMSYEECEQAVIHEFPCGHKERMPCKLVAPLVTNLPTCPAPCRKTLLCGHKCPNRCGERCPVMCVQEVERTLATCGHTAKMKCCDDSKSFRCTTDVRMTMPSCSHSVTIVCADKDNALKCPDKCKGFKQPCGHRCARRCGECMRDGEHDCDQRCLIRLRCGHPCISGCGKPCQPCTAPCRSQCSHVKCGLPPGKPGVKDFHNRKCSDRCVLCNRVCDNACSHRSCKRRCYEVCDVGACEEPCKEILRCNHVCMGMCGEPCPKVCGVCHLVQYKTILTNCMGEGALKGGKEVVRLLQMPECGHVFPVEYVDEKVAEQKEAKVMYLRCPQCDSCIDEIKRYTRVKKRMVMEAEREKYKRIIRDSPTSVDQIYKNVKSLGYKNMKLTDLGRVFAEMQAKMIRTYKSVQGGKGASRGRLGPWGDVYQQVYDMSVEMRQTVDSAPKKEERMLFWKAAARCASAIHDLMMQILLEAEKCRLIFVEDTLINLKCIVLDAFNGKRARIPLVKEAFVDLCQALQNGMQERQAGVIVPAVYGPLLKATFYFHMDRLHQYVRDANLRRVFQENQAEGTPTPAEAVKTIDLPADVMRRVRNVIKEIKDDFSNPCKHPLEEMESMMKLINDEVYKKLLNRPDLIIPTIPFEMPSF